ncbi:hypothetical protein GobsT_23010 [Gemmata obscuriglobus]|uniref:Uncharacterized protein n=1 Tax=Gemmata obscuriglobus TaxID=114 RepID=A0A2Z3H044_9BACT|nr:hypothetical protein [Gemmata obscuriglobus]AWM39383.1 hypothetical protein C1280_21940 [Gemmata obscuriglobus]QEG27545.1 hypothetical protein GobsT_23010 [Gemmata obscuriglobus]VTS04609.1 Hypothetical conserved protein OS=uncultured planctomycete GN=HGMM_F09D09C15 PE=4 SV=1 [Gemmata obscuriglobus UQM 2246]
MLTVHLRVTDAATTRPLPVRVRVSGPDGAQYAPLGFSPQFPGGRNEAVGGQLRVGRERWFYVGGACEVPLPAGVPLQIQAAKGPEWVPLDETVTLGAGQISLRFALSRWADTRPDGWATVDTRCHFLPPHAALLEARAEDLDVANLLAVPFPLLALDANTYATAPNMLAFSGQSPALVGDGCAVYVNTFNTHPVLGKVALLNSHRPVLPLTFGGEESDDWGVCDWADQCHRKGGLVVWADAFETAGGVSGGEALVAAVLGKVDAIEVVQKPGRSPLLPWVYRLWDAGVRVPLVGASAKDSNAVRLGVTRTYARVSGVQPSDDAPSVSQQEREGEKASSWLEAVRRGRTFVTAGPLLDLVLDDSCATVTARAHPSAPRVELVANGAVIAAGDGSAAATLGEPGWVAARVTGASGFAHTSPIAFGSPARKSEAVSALVALIEQTRDWVETLGRFANPKRKQALLERCDEAAQRLAGTP